MVVMVALVLGVARLGFCQFAVVLWLGLLNGVSHPAGGGW
jgi:hypothetical protein